MDVDAAFITRVLRDLVRIDSVNPSLVEGAAGEEEAARYAAGVLDEVGLEVEWREPVPGRPSVLGVLPGRGGGRSLMLNAHLDTVGVGGMADPFSGELADGRVHGRGAYDMKGALAACIGAVKALRDAGLAPAGDVMVAAVADEEAESLGTRDLLSERRPAGAVVTEPTALEICIAHKGFVWAEVITRGRAAHGSRPDLGVDANLRMGRVLGRLEELVAELGRRSPHPLVGRPSLHAATLRGGTGPSTYADECRLVVERRTVPGETGRAAMEELRSLVEELRGDDPSLEIEVEESLARPPFETVRDAPVVGAVADALRGTLGREPGYRGEMPWMDSALLAEAGVDTVVIGPEGRGAHAAVEWVDVDSVLDLARLLAGAARRYCEERP